MSKTTPIIESYNIDEAFLYSKSYYYIKGFATARKMMYTLKALPFARKVHNGQYRKGIVNINEKEYRLPYITHVLKVANTLLSVIDTANFSDTELDILISVALLHDVIEDAPENFFKNDGYELVTDYGFSKEIYDAVKLLSKRSGATEPELDIYFNEIKKNKYTLLVKLADRSHNVEDLYNMKDERLIKYINETKRWVIPLASYAKTNYPELSNAVTCLKSKISSLIETGDANLNKYSEQLNEKNNEIEELKKQFDKILKKLESYEKK